MSGHQGNGDDIGLDARIEEAVKRILTDPDRMLAALTLRGIADEARRDGHTCSEATVKDRLGSPPHHRAIEIALKPDAETIEKQEALFESARSRFSDRTADGLSLIEAVNDTANDIGEATMNDPYFWRSLSMVPLSKTTDREIAQSIREQLAARYVSLDGMSGFVIDAFASSHGDVLDLENGLISPSEFCRAATAIMEATSKRESIEPGLLNEDERGRIMLALFLAMIQVGEKGKTELASHPILVHADEVDKARKASHDA